MILKIISGGQTGVDRAALDFALEHGIPTGGWCPKGRKAEDGPIPSPYPLRETSSTDYRVRTEKNVTDSDGTLILTLGKLTGGTAYTAKVAENHRKPYIVIDLSGKPDPKSIMAWVVQNNIQTLNVAGPRESKSPGVHDMAVDFLKRMLT